jgi:hypothetical protein
LVQTRSWNFCTASITALLDALPATSTRPKRGYGVDYHVGICRRALCHTSVLTRSSGVRPAYRTNQCHHPAARSQSERDQTRRSVSCGRPAVVETQHWRRQRLGEFMRQSRAFQNGLYSRDRSLSFDCHRPGKASAGQTRYFGIGVLG